MFNCIDCNVNTRKINEYYMVTSKIWREAKLKYNDGMVCLECLEARLGRTLKREDFQLDLPINQIDNQIGSWNKKSERFLNRLGYV
jgi:hypothetical protein